MDRASKSRARRKADDLGFDRRNYITFAIALAVIIGGWLTLAQGSITFAPIVLVIGYCVLVPAAILIGIRDHSSGAGGD